MDSVDDIGDHGRTLVPLFSPRQPSSTLPIAFVCLADRADVAAGLNAERCGGRLAWSEEHGFAFEDGVLTIEEFAGLGGM